MNFCRCIFIFSLEFNDERKIVSTLIILTNLSISSRQSRSAAANRHRDNLKGQKPFDFHDKKTVFDRFTLDQEENTPFFVHHWSIRIYCCCRSKTMTFELLVNTSVLSSLLRSLFHRVSKENQMS